MYRLADGINLARVEASPRHKPAAGDPPRSAAASLPLGEIHLSRVSPVSCFRCSLRAAIIIIPCLPISKQSPLSLPRKVSSSHDGERTRRRRRRNGGGGARGMSEDDEEKGGRRRRRRRGAASRFVPTVLLPLLVPRFQPPPTLPGQPPFAALLLLLLLLAKSRGRSDYKFSCSEVEAEVENRSTVDTYIETGSFNHSCQC